MSNEPRRCEQRLSRASVITDSVVLDVCLHLLRLLQQEYQRPGGLQTIDIYFPLCWGHSSVSAEGMFPVSCQAVFWPGLHLAGGVRELSRASRKVTSITTFQTPLGGQDFNM